MTDAPKIWMDDDGGYRWDFDDTAVVDLMQAVIDALPGGSADWEIDEAVKAYLGRLYRQRLH
jgi:hypothetical protein